LITEANTIREVIVAQSLSFKKRVKLKLNHNSTIEILKQQASMSLKERAEQFNIENKGVLTS
jgi:hypothetical protein